LNLPAPISQGTFDPSREAVFEPGRDRRCYLPHLKLPPAAVCVELSRLAYIGNRRVLTSLLKGLGFTQVTNYGARGASRAFLAQSEKVSALVFKGTDSIEEWLQNIKFAQRHWPPGGKVHRGFIEAFGPLWRELKADLTELKSPVFFTGHSLGGAMASLAATHVAPSGLITFGAPRVGDQAFIALLEKFSVDRFVSCSDLVPTLPPEALGFHHAGVMHFIGEDRRISTSPTDEHVTRERLSASLNYQKNIAWKRGNLRLREMADHAPINYVAAVLGRELA